MSIKTLCAMAGVSRSGYYAWLNAAPARSAAGTAGQRDFEQILTAYKMHGYSKGAKGIYMALLHGSTRGYESQKDPASDG